ncbi:hypothetical protein ACF1BU_06070 [Streptomyces sp. NPDC014724]|uniref:hypothetical protein n=1 Tax=unclassified Streptomyces TaxID=2593676 RepID=UPI0037004885
MRVRTLLSFSLAACAAVGALVVSAPFAGAGPRTAVAADGEVPPVAVEDFAYPDADKIFADTGIRLKRGDGHIVLTDCATATAPVELYSRGKGKFCLQLSGNSGYLSMEVPQVYGVKSNNYALTLDMEVAGTAVSFDVDRNTFASVGQSADPEHRDHTLLEVHATK